MFKYRDFVLEKKIDLILESLDDLPFILSNELCSILEDMYDSNKKYSKIAKIFLDLDLSYHEKLNLSYLDIGDDNQSIKFLDPKKAKKIQLDNSWTVADVFKNVESSNSIKIGRLTNKVIELYNKKFSETLFSGRILKFTNSEIEDFVNAYKSYYDFLNNKMDSLELVSGNEINFWYAEENYSTKNGTLGNSCMRYEECNDYLDLYNSSKSVSLLILKQPNNTVSARALVWELTDGSIFMDRIYTNDDSDTNLFIKWCEDNSCGYKFEQNSKGGHICLPKNDFKPMPVKLEAKVYSTNFNNREYEKFPYMDTLKYYYWKEGIVRNYITYSSSFVILQDTDGWCTCEDCQNDGIVDCEVCSGNGEVDCGECLEDTCDKCDGSGYKKCVDCSGDGHIKCGVCGGFSSI
jgi:hypothetical protein